MYRIRKHFWHIAIVAALALAVGAWAYAITREPMVLATAQASQKLTALTELTAPASEDLLYVIDDPSGTPASRKATLSNVGKGFASVGASGTITVGTFLNYSEQTALSISDDGVITPTGTYQPLTTTGGSEVNAITMSVSGFQTGDLTILVNEYTNNIAVSDTGTTMLSGDTTLGQHDTLTLLFDGTNWLEVGQTNN